MNESRHYVLRKNQDIELDVSDLAFGGTGIGRIATEEGDFAVFVENTIPGQRVRARVTKAAKRYAECRLLEVIRRSDEEVETPYQAIPGAPYATWPIEKQQEAKQRSAFQLYNRIGKVTDIGSLFDEYISSPRIWHYRNKMEYSFSAIRYDLETRQELNDFALGFKHRGTWWMVENLDRESGLFDAQWESSMPVIRQWCIDSGLPAWHPPGHHGFFRHIVVRRSLSKDKLLINLVTSDQGLDAFSPHAFVALCRDILGDRLAGVLHTINRDTGDRVDPLNGFTTLISGKAFIEEEILGLQFEVTMTSFFQTNPESAAILYQKVLDYVNAPGRKPGVILDLFCGTGTITQLLAKLTGEEITGVDIVESAIADARQNARRNGIQHVKFFAADAGKFLLNHPEYTNAISVIVLDPPRGGIAPKTLRKVIALDAPRIVYVSCNPATQARDTEHLAEAGYALKKISFVDQFPHTAHLEAVAIYEKTNP
jgi:23S rRNA (uracil-5-)-methyltransferase RumA